MQNLLKVLYFHRFWRDSSCRIIALLRVTRRRHRDNKNTVEPGVPDLDVWQGILCYDCLTGTIKLLSSWCCDWCCSLMLLNYVVLVFLFGCCYGFIVIAIVINTVLVLFYCC